MRKIAYLLLVLLLLPRLQASAQEKVEKKRVLVLTDIENEPDDAMSLVRFLVSCNDWEVEGLVATTSMWLKDRVAPASIKKIVLAYDSVQPNLALHAKGFPTGKELLGKVKAGLPKFGMQGVGAGMDSEGSEWVISVVDKQDSRPVWISVWGGANCLAQALWKVKQTRSPEQVAAFVKKIRVYAIDDQDDSGTWIRKTFPTLFFVYSNSTWTGISGDNFSVPGSDIFIKFAGADTAIVSDKWLTAHVRTQGALGRGYPHTLNMMEGDTPAFLNLVENGLSEPEHPDYGGWGGRYKRFPALSAGSWSDTEDAVTGIDGRQYHTNRASVWRWRDAYQHEFAARMRWTTAASYANANHPPVAKLGHANHISAKAGTKITLSEQGSTDPDGDKLTYRWLYYPEAGSYTGPLAWQPAADGRVATFTAPRVKQPATAHFILCVTDAGKTPFTRYQRVIVTLQP